MVYSQNTGGIISLYRWNKSVFPDRNRLDSSFKGIVIYGGPTKYTRKENFHVLN